MVPGRILSLFGFRNSQRVDPRDALREIIRTSLSPGTFTSLIADCYARMTRVEMVSAKPGLIVRHHTFENFPQGTTPHTTAPLDYLILDCRSC